MTEREILRSYRNAANQNAQIQILTELTGMKRLDIIMVLARNGEKLPKKCINRLFRRLDELDAQICEEESEYKEIVKAIKAIG